MRKIIFILIVTVGMTFADSNDAKKAMDTAEKVVDVVEAVTDAQKMLEQYEKIKKDIETDGKNTRISLSTTYFASEPHLGVRDKGFLGQEGNFLFGTLGVSFLPNTWNIKVSHSIILSESLDIDDHSKYAYQHESRVSPEFTEIYMKPIKRSWGDIGFGYLRHLFSYYVISFSADGTPSTAQKYIDTLDPNTGAVLQNGVGVLSGTYTQSVQGIVGYTAETVRYYMTYNFPESKNIPTGLGFKYSYGQSDQGIIVGPNKFVLNPNTVSHRVGFGIYKEDDELSSGFNFKKLYLSQERSSSEYYNQVTKAHEVFEDEIFHWEVEIALAKKWESGRIIYARGGISLGTSDITGDENVEILLGLGTVF